MKFKIDENLPVEIANLFRTAGFDATTVLEQTLGGEADQTLAAICRIEQRIMVTLDVTHVDHHGRGVAGEVAHNLLGKGPGFFQS